MTEREPPTYICLSESDTENHVFAYREGDPWWRLIATFQNKERALVYADIETDMAADAVVDGDTDYPMRSDAYAVPPSTPEPPSGIPGLINRVKAIDMLVDEATAKVTLTRPLPKDEEQSGYKPEPFGQMRGNTSAENEALAKELDEAAANNCAPKPRHYSPPMAREERVKQLMEEILRDMPALMEARPQGFLAKDLEKTYSVRVDYAGEALRRLGDKGLIRYERDYALSAVGAKFGRPLDWVVGTEANDPAFEEVAPIPSGYTDGDMEKLVMRRLPDFMEMFAGGPTIDFFHRRLGGSRAHLETAIGKLVRAGKIDLSHASGQATVVPYGWAAPVAAPVDGDAEPLEPPF
jgi:hypothetical protein